MQKVINKSVILPGFACRKFLTVEQKCKSCEGGGVTWPGNTKEKRVVMHGCCIICSASPQGRLRRKTDFTEGNFDLKNRLWNQRCAKLWQIVVIYHPIKETLTWKPQVIPWVNHKRVNEWHDAFDTCVWRLTTLCRSMSTLNSKVNGEWALLSPLLWLLRGFYGSNSRNRQSADNSPSVLIHLYSTPYRSQSLGW